MPAKDFKFYYPVLTSLKKTIFNVQLQKKNIEICTKDNSNEIKHQEILISNQNSPNHKWTILELFEGKNKEKFRPESKEPN